MKDKEIVALLFKRDETALSVCRMRYGALMRTISARILGADEAELAENDAYLDAWNTIPPREPESLASYLAMLTRRRAVDMARKRARLKRGGEAREVSLEELEECLPSACSTEKEVEAGLLTEALNKFLAGLPKQTRMIFMRRYWWLQSVSDIAAELGMTESAVKMRLARTRERLKYYLEKEGFEL